MRKYFASRKYRCLTLLLARHLRTALVFAKGRKKASLPAFVLKPWTIGIMFALLVLALVSNPSLQAFKISTQAMFVSGACTVRENTPEWTCLKQGTLADISIKRKIYRSKELIKADRNRSNEYYACLRIRNKTNRQLGLFRRSVTFHPFLIRDKQPERWPTVQYQAEESARNEYDATAIKAFIKCFGAAHSGFEFIEAKSGYDFLLPIECYKFKPSTEERLSIGGSCYLFDGQNIEAFSFDFEDSKPFVESRLNLDPQPLVSGVAPHSRVYDSRVQEFHFSEEFLSKDPSSNAEADQEGP